MSDWFFYRANPALAAALRACDAARDAFWAEHVTPYEREHPNNPPVWTRVGGATCVGFADNDDSDNPPPDGLSRAQTRTHLIPKPGKPGDIWRDRKAKFNEAPQYDKVLREFGVPYDVLGVGVLHMANWMDLDARSDTPDGSNVVVYIGREYSPVPAALEPMKRSEFYALHEAATERAKATT